jgi:hypothetical protein
MLMHHRERRLGRLPISEAFNEVYTKNMWKQGHAQSGVGSEGPFADRYVDLVRDYAAKHDLRSVVDGGCGDFSVGARLAPSFDEYTALDASSVIIESNKKRYAGLTKHVNFRVADMTAGTFPKADLILIRQVLQHLTNAQISRILRNLEASEWRRALITEDVYDRGDDGPPNVDLPSHSVRTRVSLGSGVYIDKEPFNRSAKRIAYIEGADTKESGLLVFELVRSNVA